MVTYEGAGFGGRNVLLRIFIYFFDSFKHIILVVSNPEAAVVKRLFCRACISCCGKQKVKDAGRR